jgi:hypothetical protein
MYSIGNEASGVAKSDAGDSLPTIERLLVPLIVKVYAVPGVRPLTVIGEDAPVAVAPPGLAVTV